MNFNNIFILDLANNHQGSVVHAKNIIDSMIGVTPEKTYIKFQLRDLDTLIHPDYKDSPQAQRFLTTRLEFTEFADITNHLRDKGFLLASTPFDEKSVERACQLDSDLLKVASCSADDWPLIQAIALTGKPVVFSTGGLTLNQVDNIVSFCEHKGVDFALHHCVSIYPTKNDQLNLSRIKDFKERYRVTVGWSTHEDPNDTSIVKMAYSLGARMFERHIGLGERNAYSSDREQIKAWVWAYHEAKAALSEPTQETVQIEQANLNPWKRGLYPTGRMIPNNLEGVIKEESVITDAFILKQSVHEIKALLNYAGVSLPSVFETEFSHHYGVGKFREIGTTMIEMVNRDYAKKLLIQLPGQSHPAHYHKVKDEAFCLLWGDMTINLEGKERVLPLGEILVVPPGIWHSFRSQKGAIIEEVSTAAIQGDSVYKDPLILQNRNRKTKVTNWGRFELNHSPLLLAASGGVATKDILPMARAKS